MNTQFLQSQTCNLSGGYFTIERNGQCAADVSDDVIVKAIVYLPIQDSGGVRLKKELIFGDRLRFCSEVLNYNWGKVDDNYKYRTANQYFTASTWKEAFAKADKYCGDEFDKLRDIIQKRQQALIDAEN